MERSTRVVGTSSTRMPCDASMRPVAPGTTLALLTRRSARRTLTMRLGRTSRSWGFWLPRASASTSTRSPPTASVSAFKSVVVVTTRILSAAAPLPAQRPRASRLAVITETIPGIGVSLSSLERVRRMGAQDERGLEEDLVDLAGGRVVVAEAVPLVSLRVLVAQAEAEELGGHEGQVRAHRPLVAAQDRELGPVVAEPGRPAGELADPERLDLATRVPAPTVAEAGLVGRVRDPVAVDVL